jgi:hypothetical protein
MQARWYFRPRYCARLKPADSLCRPVIRATDVAGRTRRVARDVSSASLDALPLATAGGVSEIERPAAAAV